VIPTQHRIGGQKHNTATAAHLRLPNLHPERREERERHAAADDDRVRLLDERAQHTNLVGDLFERVVWK
jgi:hypothetical protein